VLLCRGAGTLSLDAVIRRSLLHLPNPAI